MLFKMAEGQWGEHIKETQVTIWNCSIFLSNGFNFFLYNMCHVSIAY